MRGSIIGPLNNNPQGRFLEGIIDDTSKPGTLMELTPGGAEVSGRLHYRHYQPGADGDPKAIIVLLEDSIQGKIFSDAYVSGTRCFMYMPANGDELNMLMAGATGTGSLSTAAVGSRLRGQTSSGKLILDATATDICPFQSMEHLTESPPDTDQWVLCQYSAN